jgi:hypothetical protein
LKGATQAHQSRILTSINKVSECESSAQEPDEPKTSWGGVTIFQFSLLKDNNNKNIGIEIHMTSSILDVCGFPIKIMLDENPIKKINEVLGLS